MYTRYKICKIFKCITTDLIFIFCPFLQELFCIGTELSLDALREIKEAVGAAKTADSAAQLSPYQCPSLMTLASRGGGRVPLDAVVRFVRLARSYNQREVVEMLAKPTIRLAKVYTCTYSRKFW
jgi:hypothetical protein